MRTSDKVYRLTLAAAQIAGLMSFALDGPHFPVILKIVGWVLLLPGTLAALALEEIGLGVDLSLAIALGCVCLLANFGAWYAARRIWLAVGSRIHPEK